MPTDIQFYHLLSTPLEKALPKLMEKAYGAGFRSLVLARDETHVEMLNQALWSYDASKFLPHGSAADGHAQEQPIYITAQAENPNQATLLVVADGSALDALDDFKRVLDIFDGTDDTATSAARQRWKQYTDAGHRLTYNKQTATGGWEQLGKQQ